MVKDTDNVLQVQNVQVNGIDVALVHIRDGAIYIGGMTAAGKIVKNCSLPIGAKLGATLGMGAASLIGYKMVQNNLLSNKPRDTINLKVDKIKTDTSYKNKLVSDSNDINTSPENKTYLSDLDVEQLQLDYYLQVVILYLLILALIFLIMKYISDKNINNIDSLPLSNNLKKILKKILS
jgi:hypothetical protein